MKQYLQPSEILLPHFPVSDCEAWKKWAVIACDQFTSEPEYWKKAEELVGDAPSALRTILPEVALSDRKLLTPKIHAEMERLLLSNTFDSKEGMIYLSRTQSDGTVREGIVAMVDLEDYDYEKGASTLIRATEGTVLERIPPRVEVRRRAPIELPHVMLLIDDPECTVIEPIGADSANYTPAYEFELMLGGGRVSGKWIPELKYKKLNLALSRLIEPSAMQKRYGNGALSALLFAVGDGNHSLATAKAHYEELKTLLGSEKAEKHPARYALCEIVNLHSPALRFEPIYRVVFRADTADLLSAFRRYAEMQCGNNAAPQRFTYYKDGETGEITVESPTFQLPVASLQTFLDAYLKTHPDVEIDYIHGEDSVKALSVNGAIGFLFEGMEKGQLFRTVLYDGALPRKTFSMGHARDKRYYIEARKIL